MYMIWFGLVKICLNFPCKIVVDLITSQTQDLNDNTIFFRINKTRRLTSWGSFTFLLKYMSVI